MKVTKEKTEQRQAFLTVELESAEMAEAMEGAYKRLVKKTSIPGFRKGKAPRDVLERSIGRESLLEEAINSMVPQAYEQAVKEQELEPWGQPEIEITQAEPVIFTAVVPLSPTVELGDYNSVRVKMETEEITDEKTDAVMEEIRHQHASWEPVERPVEMGDLVTANIDGTVDERPFVKRLASQYQVEAGAAAPAPGFPEQLVGMNKGEEKEFKLTLPEDYQRPELAGKEVSFKVKIEEIKQEILPEMNDELAGMVSKEFKTVADLREEVVKNLKIQAEEKARMEFEEKVVTSVMDQAAVEYPPVVVEMEINRIINEQARQVQMSGRNMEDYLRSIGKTIEQMREDLRPVANKNIVASLVLGKVAEAEQSSVEEAEIDERLDGMVAGTDESRKEELRKMFDTPNTRESIRQNLMTRKTIDRLAEIAASDEAAGTDKPAKTARAAKGTKKAKAAEKEADNEPATE